MYYIYIYRGALRVKVMYLCTRGGGVMVKHMCDAYERHIARRTCGLRGNVYPRIFVYFRVYDELL